MSILFLIVFHWKSIVFARDFITFFLQISLSSRKTDLSNLFTSKECNLERAPRVEIISFFNHLHHLTFWHEFSPCLDIMSKIALEAICYIACLPAKNRYVLVRTISFFSAFSLSLSLTPQ